MADLKPIVMNTEEYSPGVLRCPSCKESYLHHERVVVWARGEDADGVRIEVEPSGAAGVTPTQAKDFPKDWRRQSLTIEFCCEHCKAKPVLEIAQHKGNTRVGWR